MTQGRSRRIHVTLGALLLATLAAVAIRADAKIVDVIEFYHAAKDHYFFTSVPA